MQGGPGIFINWVMGRAIPSSIGCVPGRIIEISLAPATQYLLPAVCSSKLSSVIFISSPEEKLSKFSGNFVSFFAFILRF